MAFLQSDEAKASQNQSNKSSRELAEIIIKQLQDLRYGSIEIVVHDSKVVQVEKKEKTRFTSQLI